MRRALINWVGLVLVGASAAILTFNTLRSLAETCGFAGWLGWLLPVAVDAAGAVATNVWLTGRDSPETVRFARTWALTAAVVSLAGNATEHGLHAYGRLPPWWVAVAVAVIPPLALVGTVHLMVLLSKGVHHLESPVPTDLSEPFAPVGPADVDRVELGTPCDVVPHRGVDAAQVVERRARLGEHPARTLPDPVAELIASGAGRGRLSRELGISQHKARQLIAAHTGGDR